jgi:ketosteroid isomerase-like protein
MLFAISAGQRWSDPDADIDPVAGAPAVAPRVDGTLEATAAEPPAAPADAPAAAPAPDPVPAAGTPVTPGEATAVIDQFRSAYEARDVERLVQLFSTDASQNGVQGIDAIRSSYRDSLPALNDVHYELSTFSIEPRGERADVRGPFVITYRTSNGASGEIRGHAEWELERREGRASIVALNYRLDG